jgi:hypothetical protein
MGQICGFWDFILGGHGGAREIVHGFICSKRPGSGTVVLDNSDCRQGMENGTGWHGNGRTGIGCDRTEKSCIVKCKMRAQVLQATRKRTGGEEGFLFPWRYGCRLGRGSAWAEIGTRMG